MVCPACPIIAGSTAIIAAGVGAGGGAAAAALGYARAAVFIFVPISAISIGYYKYNSNDYSSPYKNKECIDSAPGTQNITLTKASTILGKDGNTIFASPGPDNFFFSMCSTKKSATIINFNSSQDKIFIFCTKQTIVDPKIHYDENANFTHIIIHTAHTTTDIKIEGEHENPNLVLNTKFAAFCNGETPYWSANNA